MGPSRNDQALSGLPSSTSTPDTVYWLLVCLRRGGDFVTFPSQSQGKSLPIIRNISLPHIYGCMDVWKFTRSVLQDIGPFGLLPCSHPNLNQHWSRAAGTVDHIRSLGDWFFFFSLSFSFSSPFFSHFVLSSEFPFSF